MTRIGWVLVVLPAPLMAPPVQFSTSVTVTAARPAVTRTRGRSRPGGYFRHRSIKSAKAAVKRVRMSLTGSLVRLPASSIA